MKRPHTPILSDEFDADSITDPMATSFDWKSLIVEDVSDDPFDHELEFEPDNLEPLTF